MFRIRYPIETTNIIKELFTPFKKFNIHIAKSATLLPNSTHQHSLKRRFINIIAHMFIALEVASKKANCCPGIFLNKNPKDKLPAKMFFLKSVSVYKLPAKQQMVIKTDILLLKLLILTSLFLFFFVCQSTNP